MDALLEALNLSPDNIPLRYHVAFEYFKDQNYTDAEMHIKELLQRDPGHVDAMILLGKIYFQQKKYGAVIVVFENINIEKHPEAWVILVQALHKEGDVEEARNSYQALLELYPDNNIEDLDEEFRVKSVPIDEDMVSDDTVFSSSDINFSNVGGMDYVKKQIDLKIIKPIQHRELYKQYGKKIGGGILLYGPPGCGKTYIARATAGEINANFINLTINDVLDMWVGNSEKKLHEIFEAARRNKPCVIFIDELDALGSKRTSNHNSSTQSVINQLLVELDGFDDKNDGILVIGATNVPWHTDPALLRPGRFDRVILVPPPDADGRKAIFKVHLEGKPTENLDYDKLAKVTNECTGSDIMGIIGTCVEDKFEEAINAGKAINIKTKDLVKAAKKHKALAVKEWMKTAKNYALYSNQSGVYDEFVDYLKLK